MTRCCRRSACAVLCSGSVMVRCMRLPDGRLLADSYHCSRLNTNTGKLTPAMFEAVFAEVLDRIEPGRGGRAMRQAHGTVAEPR